MVNRLRPIHYVVLAVALTACVLLWYMVNLRPGDDQAEIYERTQETIQQLDMIRGSVREQMLREAGRALPTADEQQRIRERTRALMEERMTEAGVPNELHNIMQNTVERDVMQEIMPLGDTMTMMGSDTGLRLYRRAPDSGPVVYY